MGSNPTLGTVIWQSGLRPIFCGKAVLDFFGGTGKYPLYNEEESRGLTNSADFGSAYLRNREGSEAEYAKKNEPPCFPARRGQRV